MLFAIKVHYVLTKYILSPEHSPLSNFKWENIALISALMLYRNSKSQHNASSQKDFFKENSNCFRIILKA